MRFSKAVGLALGVGFGLLAMAGSFPDEPRFRVPVNLKVESSPVQTRLTLPLDVVLEALAKSAGLQPLIYRAYDASGDPAKAQPPLPNIKLDFQGKPFREVWDLLFATYGTQFNLDYLFLPPDVVVVAPTQVITALVDAPSRTGHAERRPYIVGIPAGVYLKQTQLEGGRTQTDVDTEKAKAWIKDDLLPFLSREAAGLSVNWIMVEEGTRLKALLSVLATPEQHARFTDILLRAGIDFRPLPALTPQVERTYTLTQATFPEVLGFLRTLVPDIRISVVPTNPWQAVVLATEENHSRLTQILSIIDNPGRFGEAERRPYMVVIPEISYRRTETDAQGQARTVVNIDGAKAWVQNDLLPFLSREASGLSVNWIVVEEGGKLRALLSVLATPEQHTRFSDILQRAGIDFRPLPALTLPKPRVERTYALTHSTFSEILSFLQTQVPNAQVAVVPTDPKRALITATEDDHARIAELLKTADVPKPRVEHRTYTLTHATFPDLLSFLQNQVPGAQITPVPTDPKRALITATEEDHARIAELLKTADVPKPRVEHRTYTLNYADAEKVKEFLEKEVAGITVQVAPVQSLLSVPEREEVQVKQEGFISVRPRTLSVRGTEEQLAEVEKLLAQLDQAPKQVNLRVRIQEVQSTFIRNLGLKWNTVGGGNIVASILDSGLSLIFDSTKSLAALNIIATLEALQRQGLSRALRDVNQTVLNNQTARLQSGETFLIRRVVENRVERVPFDIGIIVAITPKVTEDGSILLSINAEVSGNVQRNPVDGDVDRFTKQQITTTLRLKDGQTVILGGLTSQENSQVQQGVPLLMDIPLIGELFKQRTQETTDRELLVVITADIVKETASR
ncbi:hypothetical protein Thermus77359_19490 [Thermus oshimai]